MIAGNLALILKNPHCSVVVLIAPLVVHRERLDDGNPILRMEVGHSPSWLRLHT
jgi:hypothetical protein